MQHCTSWIEENCPIQDPSVPGGVLHFKLYDYQKEFAPDPEGAKRPTDLDGRVTRKTDLERTEAEHAADALSCGIAFYRCRTHASLPQVPTSRHRPYTAGLLDKQF